MGIPHVLAVPYPAQGHVIPLMEMSIYLAKQGIRVTFVNTEFNHKRFIKSLSITDDVPDQIHMASIPDGLESSEDRNVLGKLTEAIFEIMPGELEVLLERMNATEDDKVTCLLADENMGWALEVAKKKGIKSAAFWPASAAILALQFSIPHPVGFRDRIQGRGRLAGWVPQQNVLNHPSIACFLTHCGWNSTIEGISNGLPLLCWPYFADQFLNETYICDKWKVGLRFKRNENGIIERGEIKKKVEELLENGEYRERVICLKENIMKDVGEEGGSGNNLGNFIKWIKEEEN